MVAMLVGCGQSLPVITLETSTMETTDETPHI